MRRLMVSDQWNNRTHEIVEPKEMAETKKFTHIHQTMLLNSQPKVVCDSVWHAIQLQCALSVFGAHEWQITSHEKFMRTKAVERK